MWIGGMIVGKIICDICGTTYPDTAECCPICGCSRETASLLGDDLLLEQIQEEPKAAKGGRFSSSKKKKEIFDFDEVNSELDETVAEETNPYEGEEEDYDDGPRHNTVLVIILTVLIALLLIAAGFLFIRFYLPNLGTENKVQETMPPPVIQTVPETTQYGVPCQSLVLTSGTAELKGEGQFFLLHVLAMPEDTTDQIVYTSADETIATVSEDGRITAISEGETVVYITCGNIQLTCPVVCRFEEETVPTTEETVAETAAETVPETTAPPAVVLKLKQTDFKLGVYYEHQLLLDCDLEQDQVEWTSEHPYIASVDENGVVKALKEGTTSIIVKYGDQEAKCIVRCGWY